MRTIPFVCGGPSPDLLDCPEMGCLLHHAVREPLLQLRESAVNEGFELRIASGYRNFERQLAIWNAKLTGQRPVVDQNGKFLDISKLEEEEKVFAILRWSALPGTSRHHWGTDFDVYDRASIDSEYKLKLSTEEYVLGGPFYKLNQWLEEQIRAGDSHGFYRPYGRDRGGVAPEPWHLSYRPMATLFEQQLSVDLVSNIVSAVDIECKRTVLSLMDEIFARFVLANTVGDGSG